jgi:hypothetical protein
VIVPASATSAVVGSAFCTGIVRFESMVDTGQICRITFAWNMRSTMRRSMSVGMPAPPEPSDSARISPASPVATALSQRAAYSSLERSTIFASVGFAR